MAVNSNIYQKYFLGCICNPKGTQGEEICAHTPTGECRCLAGVTGFLCDQCDNGFYGFGHDSNIGCKSKS